MLCKLCLYLHTSISNDNFYAYLLLWNFVDAASVIVNHHFFYSRKSSEEIKGSCTDHNNNMISSLNDISDENLIDS